MRLIVGLGNVGSEFEGTRHNVGFLAVRWLARQWGIESDWRQTRHRALIAKNPELDVLLAQPTTMMNASGQAVRGLMDYYHIEPDKLLVIHDDADLELGQIKYVDATASGAGHHGVLSIIQHVEGSFPRIRVGIGRPEQPVRDISNYVLGHYRPEDRRQLEQIFDQQLLALIPG